MNVKTYYFFKTLTHPFGVVSRILLLDWLSRDHVHFRFHIPRSNRQIIASSAVAGVKQYCCHRQTYEEIIFSRYDLTHHSDICLPSMLILTARWSPLPINCFRSLNFRNCFWNRFIVFAGFCDNLKIYKNI